MPVLRPRRITGRIYDAVELGTALVLARLLSAWGLLSAEGQSFGRQSGAGLTVLVLVSVSVLILLRWSGVM